MTIASRLLAACVAVAAVAAPAAANGRPPAASTINFKRGDPSHIWAGMTFGALQSKDGGATWHWVCETAIVYSGIYDPFYAYTASGTIFATTFDGSLVNRTGCTFDESSTFGKNFVSTLTQGPDGAIFMALAQPAIGADPGDSKIYRSTDDGMTFPVSAEPGQVNDWWSSIKVAPSDPQRVYLTGYRLDSGGRTQLLFRSSNGGASYEPMGTTGLVFTNNTAADVVGVSPTDPDVVYMKMDFQIDDSQTSVSIYRSTDGGDSWTNILQLPTDISFVARQNGDIVAATQMMGTQVMRAPATGTTWETVAGAPHVNCLYENELGEVWACTANYDLVTSPGMVEPGTNDGAGIMKTTDLTTWTPVLRFQDILAPLPCSEDTIQYAECQAKQWCILRTQLGIEANPTCCVRPDGGQYVQDCSLLNGDGPPPGSKPGCCDSNASGAQTGALIGFLGTALVLRRRRRR